MITCGCVFAGTAAPSVEDFDPFASLHGPPASTTPAASHGDAKPATAPSADLGGDWAAFNEDVFTDFYDADEAPDAVGDGQDVAEEALRTAGAEGAGTVDGGLGLPR